MKLKNRHLSSMSEGDHKHQSSTGMSKAKKIIRTPKRNKVKVIFPCPKCSLNFLFKSRLIQHLERRHPVLFKVLHPNVDKENKAANKRNVSKYTEFPKSENVFQNKIINSDVSKADTNNNNQKVPLSVSYRDRVFRCMKCRENIYGEIKFEEHYNSIHSLSKNNLCKCSECSEEFKSKPDLFWHCHTAHYQLKMHKCSECEIICSEKTRLEEHIKATHTKNDSEVICLEKVRMEEHIKDAHTNKDVEVICSEKVELEDHVKATHTKDDDFKCWECDELFSVEENLIQHFDSQHFQA